MESWRWIDGEGLDDLLGRAVDLGIFGTKMRSVINLASRAGISAIVEQQFLFARTIAARGLLPIIETEVLITSPQKAEAEALLVEELRQRLDALPRGLDVILN